MKLHVELESKEMLTPIGFAEAVIDYWIETTVDPDGLDVEEANLWEIARHIEIFLKADQRRKDIINQMTLTKGV